MKCSILIKPETVLVNQISVSVFSGEVHFVQASLTMDGIRRQTKWERLMFERARVESSSVQKVSRTI
jgi:hypothetical protein